MLDVIFGIGDAIMFPLYYLTSGVLLAWHTLFSLVMPSDSGASWILSIIGLTVVIRAALIPLFVKQIKSSRNMQLLQPRVKELQKKYSHDRERLTQETMALYKETGTNPFASCLPLLLQMPIFFALFRVVDHAARNRQGHGFLTDTDARIFADAKIFGITISDALTTDGAGTSTIALAVVLVLAMTATTFMTQRQLMSKNMPADAMSGPYAQQQKMLLYVLPLVFAVGGIAFPIAVLFYWTTSNLWTMCQQFYVIRNNPAPGTPAFAAKESRDKAKGKGAVSLDKPAEGGSVATDTVAKPAPPRPQPQRQTRSERAAKKPAPGSGQATPTKSTPGKTTPGKTTPGKGSPGQGGTSRGQTPKTNKKKK